jgi:coenzyme F420-0:L-glutamate ligase / coenzyme F420-1:gamma-L-glutamate ligase
MEPVILYPIKNLPIISFKNDLEKLLLKQIEKNIGILEKDILVVAHKIVSKAEGSIVRLADIVVTKEAEKIAKITNRDPRICQVYLDEAREVIAIKGRMVITVHRLGFINSNSAVDFSNVSSDKEIAVLLPKNPDLSAAKIRKYIYEKTGKKVAVIINDSFGRDDREGSIGTAIGIAGIRAIETRKQKDLFGNKSISNIALIDELSAAASILMGQGDEKIPAVIVRGVSFKAVERTSIKNILN